MRKQYLLPHTQVQIISVSQLICGSTPSIEKGGKINGNDITPGGIYA